MALGMLRVTTRAVLNDIADEHTAAKAFASSSRNLPT